MVKKLLTSLANIGQQSKAFYFLRVNLAATTVEMKQFKNLFPFIAAIGVSFLASNSPMWKRMVQKTKSNLSLYRNLNSYRM